MSGIYIPGMDMPKDGSFEVLVVHDNGIVTKGFFPNENEHTKAIFIPDHGRLIDADKIPFVTSEDGVLEDWAFRYDINDMPTIIPAEEGE